MPGGDRTGPYGEGPMTGRRMGYCAGNNRPGFANVGAYRGRGYGRAFGSGFGRGRGFGFGPGFRYGSFYSEPLPDVSERTMIENEIRILKDQLSSLEEQLSKTKEE